MRQTAFASSLILFLLLTSSPGEAAPTLSLVWSSTTGTGTTGGSTISARVGDRLEVDAVVTIDAEGFTGVAWDLVGTSGLTAAANTLVPAAGGPPECPAPPNLAPGTCFSTTFKSFTPLMVGVLDVGASTTRYDVAGLTPEFVPSTITVGRGVFVVGRGASPIETVSTFFAPGAGGVTDGDFVFSVPPTDTARINVLDAGTVDPPEASTSYLLGTTSVSVDFRSDDQPQLLRIGESGETSFPIYLVKPAEIFVKFTAECAVAASDDTTWVDVDLLVDGVAIAPTDDDDAFCTSSGTGEINRWVSAARDASVSLGAGLHALEIRSRIPASVYVPGESWWIDDKTLVVIVKTEDN